MQDRPIDSYISHYQKYFPEEFCDLWVSYFENVDWSIHKWGSNLGDVGFTLHNSEPEVYFLDDNDKDHKFQNIIYNNLKNCLSNYEQDIKGCTYVSQFSRLRLNKYSADKRMSSHVDHIYDLFDGTTRGIPVLSFIINLNDNYEGGDLVFFDDTEIHLSKGDVVIFPSNFMYPHLISPVKNGVRYSLVAWGF